MDLVSQMQRQFVDYKNSLFREGFLDDQFKQLLQLQDESNPGFVVEVVSLFFQDSEKLLNNLATALQQQIVDYKQVDAYVHQFKGSSSSIGALKVKNECVAFRNYCDEKNRERCEKCLEQLKREYIAVKNKLGTLFQMERHILLRGGSIPLE
ncbi:histidine-containing phosphotransfer protein 1-like isoform X1 [Rhododendron vialii]|uniref:Histidine-containing phosphotransfer protein n=1 Tax=Rhododendron griersonianum TaxID=479676 RepID=A0AAV6LR61_9ERIC|nr:histidine-containing phosphotransfer protein 1-like isoform X1 [Rhododendron vialii]XP_058210186.1 histidine-containing phosphotransfer protein 1-like isoform X1 [Rhododendron vialii]KAG5567638.1 hypothetical protein RHGRI_002990 [Rhododendron griersonianum]